MERHHQELVKIHEQKVYEQQSVKSARARDFINHAFECYNGSYSRQEGTGNHTNARASSRSHEPEENDENDAYFLNMPC